MRIRDVLSISSMFPTQAPLHCSVRSAKNGPRGIHENCMNSKGL